MIDAYDCIAILKFISITRIIKMSKLRFSNMYLRCKQKIPSFRPCLPSCTSYLQDHGLTATDVSCWSYLQCLDMWFQTESFLSTSTFSMSWRPNICCSNVFKVSYNAIVINTKYSPNHIVRFKILINQKLPSNQTRNYC